jgi:hypothetical protein
MHEEIQLIIGIMKQKMKATRKRRARTKVRREKCDVCPFRKGTLNLLSAQHLLVGLFILRLRRFHVCNFPKIIQVRMMTTAVAVHGGGWAFLMLIKWQQLLMKRTPYFNLSLSVANCYTPPLII